MKLGNNYAREQLDEWIQREEAQETNRYMMLENEWIPNIQYKFWCVRDDTKWRGRDAATNQQRRRNEWNKQNNNNNNKEISTEVYQWDLSDPVDSIGRYAMTRCVVYFPVFFSFSIFSFVLLNFLFFFVNSNYLSECKVFKSGWGGKQRGWKRII